MAAIGMQWAGAGVPRHSQHSGGAAMSLLAGDTEYTSSVCHIIYMQIQRTAAPWQQQPARLPNLPALRRAVCGRRPRRRLVAQVERS